MREVKFRAWDKHNKIMAPVVELVFDQYGGIDVRPSHRLGINDDSLGNSSLMEYTGLKDKNGKEIFEGDIVKSTRFPKAECYEVRWDDFGWSPFLGENDCCGCFPTTWPSVCEIIGNIYENPEFLKG